MDVEVSAVVKRGRTVEELQLEELRFQLLRVQSWSLFQIKGSKGYRGALLGALSISCMAEFALIPLMAYSEAISSSLSIFFLFDT